MEFFLLITVLMNAGAEQRAQCGCGMPDAFWI
jgi:hypothetical protein